MYNPFVEDETVDPSDEELVALAQQGERDALERLVRRHQRWIFNIAVRMVWDPQDAEDVTQEILVKLITKLGSFRGTSKLRTWLYRIVANHVLNMQRRQSEPEALSFSQFAEGLHGQPELELPDPKSVPVALPLLVEEAQIGCTIAMILCFDRRQRLVFILGELLGVSSTLGAEIVGVSAANFRQLLTRARQDMRAFMAGNCGLVEPSNPCRCAKKTRAFMQAGYVDPENMRFASERMTRIHEVAPARTDELIDALRRQPAEVHRDQPFLTVRDQVALIRKLLDA